MENMYQVNAKFVHRILTLDQRQRCVNVCLEFHEMTKDDTTFISRIIGGQNLDLPGLCDLPHSMKRN